MSTECRHVRSLYLLVSIPQAVSTIAIKSLINKRREEVKVSIPQAVSTIAMTAVNYGPMRTCLECFNTASGKYYCNWIYYCIWCDICV